MCEGDDSAAQSYDDSYALRAFGMFSGAVTLPMVGSSATALGEALCRRRSGAIFSGASLPLRRFATILSDGVGRIDDPSRLSSWGPPGPRAYPSGGALYGIELLVVAQHVDDLPPGVWYHQPLAQRLVPWAPADPAITAAFANPGLADAAALVLLFVDFTRPSFRRYGDKQYRLMFIEAGHLAQNFLLIAAAEALTALPICGYADETLSRCAGLAFPQQSVVYAVALGPGAAA